MADGGRPASSSTARGAAKAEQEQEADSKALSFKSKYRSRQGLPDDWNKIPAFSRTRSLPAIEPSESSDEADAEEVNRSLFLLPAFAPADAQGPIPALDTDSDAFLIGVSSSTPPLTPGLSPSSSSVSRARDLSWVIQDSPYDPKTTPSFRHSPARLPSDQPWKYNSPSHPLYATKDLSLSMLAYAEASPMVRGLDVSPVVLVPASERSKRSIFSSPLFMSKKDGSSPDLDAILKARGHFRPSPRRLFPDAGCPTPFTDRLESSKKFKLPETPLRSAFTPRKLPESALQKRTTPWRAALSPFKSPTKGTKLLGPIELEGEDPFDNTYKTLLANEALEACPDSPPSSGPECDSPVLRSARLGPPLSQSSSCDGHEHSASQASDGDVGLGIGLMEGFSLKEDGSRKATVGTLMDVALQNDDTASSRRDAKRSRMFAGFSNGSPMSTAHPNKKPKRGFLMDTILDGDGDSEMHDVFHLKKRRKTITSSD
jgi:hypothetical protein